MQTSFLRKTLVASKQNSTFSIPSEWYGIEVEVIAFPVDKQSNGFNDMQDDKMSILNSFLDFTDSNGVIEKDYRFDRESCYDR